MITPKNEEHVNRLLAEVWLERAQQDGVWGEQHHPLGTSESFADAADYFRQVCDRNDADGTVTWTDILSEEFYEALAEVDVKKVREEMIQVAAVALAIVEDIDLRGAK